MIEDQLKTVWFNSLMSFYNVVEEFFYDTNKESLTPFSKAIIKTIKKDGKLFIAGNGGSHADALHFAEELTGKYRKERKPIGAIALGEATHLTCTSNDFGFEQVFSRQLEALATSKDFLIILSTSGNSSNLINLANKAKELKVNTFSLLGKEGGKLKNLTNNLVVPGETSDRIQELHMMILHILVEVIERSLFPENYK